ncbi:hypothetical protein GYMLUDRAFT_84407 [Collybiopsis luxurians FD-317 M1]|uniref:Uncharacterized protein n=1 Tax=Collybiopsis luxurians FD-317 M1 TaxID=944289 RepID=A0A0D0C300_9AGAR|nr:hypothetical protein GYMLUDRAFT_84407 [Collybiopsis luxurians FD-317 M1]
MDFGLATRRWREIDQTVNAHGIWLFFHFKMADCGALGHRMKFIYLYFSASPHSQCRNEDSTCNVRFILHALYPPAGLSGRTSSISSYVQLNALSPEMATAATCQIILNGRSRDTFATQDSRNIEASRIHPQSCEFEVPQMLMINELPESHPQRPLVGIEADSIQSRDGSLSNSMHIKGESDAPIFIHTACFDETKTEVKAARSPQPADWVRTTDSRHTDRHLEFLHETKSPAYRRRSFPRLTEKEKELHKPLDHLMTVNNWLVYDKSEASMALSNPFAKSFRCFFILDTYLPTLHTSHQE